jgi:hypothetical protein
MWRYISSFFAGQNTPRSESSEPPPVTITGARFPVDGSRPHLVTLTTTPASSEASDSYLFHVPDLRAFWQDEEGWKFRDIQQIELQNQLHPNCNGLYLAFYTYTAWRLPVNEHFPVKLMFTPRGDVFVVKLQPHEFGENAWAAYDNVAEEFLDLPVMVRKRLWSLPG